jgi:hypothetical protein
MRPSALSIVVAVWAVAAVAICGAVVVPLAVSLIGGAR